MRRPFRSAVRIAGVTVAAALLAAVIQIAPVPRDPYASSLADLSVASNALAANICNKVCNQAPRGLKFRCDAAQVTTSCRLINGGNDCAVGSC